MDRTRAFSVEAAVIFWDHAMSNPFLAAAPMDFTFRQSQTTRTMNTRM